MTGAPERGEKKAPSYGLIVAGLTVLVAVMLGASLGGWTFTPDSRWLVVSGGGEVGLWPLERARMIDAACSRLRRRANGAADLNEIFEVEAICPGQVVAAVVVRHAATCNLVLQVRDPSSLHEREDHEHPDHDAADRGDEPGVATGLLALPVLGR